MPIAPLDSLLDALDDAMRTAIDDNIFQVSQPLLALRLFYRPDDALVNVHKVSTRLCRRRYSTSPQALNWAIVII